MSFLNLLLDYLCLCGCYQVPSRAQATSQIGPFVRGKEKPVQGACSWAAPSARPLSISGSSVFAPVSCTGAPVAVFYCNLKSVLLGNRYLKHHIFRDIKLLDKFTLCFF